MGCLCIFNSQLRCVVVVLLYYVTRSSVIVSQIHLIGLPISALAETARLSEKHPADAVANRSLPPQPESPLLQSPYHCPIIAHDKGNDRAMIWQFLQEQHPKSAI